MNDSSVSLMLMLPHQMSSVLSGLSTIRLSLGLRPVFAPERVARPPDEVMAESPEQGHDPGPSVDAEILVQRLMGFVSPEERACLTLAYAAGMSHPEIGKITDLPLGTVKSHIQRGKHKLQRWLQDHDHSIPKDKTRAGAAPAKEARSA